VPMAMRIWGSNEYLKSSGHMWSHALDRN
jgi:hypothetical protein